MRKTIYVFTPIFILLLLITSLTSSIKLSEDISNKVFRLHIRANSDEMFDQNLKLKVRDELLNDTESIFNNCKSVDEAIRSAKDNIDIIKDSVINTIRANGYEYGCSVRIGKEYFNTRKYDDFTLPAGVYESLIVEIGSGKGHNWWCVMFPSVCISGCTKDFDEVLTENERNLIEKDKYIVKFKAVEIYEKLKNKLIYLDFSFENKYTVLVQFAGVMELADVPDSKSGPGNRVRVRPPPPAPKATSQPLGWVVVFLIRQNQWGSKRRENCKAVRKKTVQWTVFADVGV